MKKLVTFLIALLLIGCSADDSSSSNSTDQTRNNILTGTWTYTYSITYQRTDTFELNAAGGIMSGYFINTHYGDYLTLYGDYTETEMGFVCNNLDADIRYYLDGTYTSNSMTGIMQVKTMSGELITQCEFTAVKQ